MIINLLVFSFVLLVELSFASIKIPLYSYGKHDLQKSEENLMWSNYPNDYLLTNISIGTPPKEFWLTVESGSRYLWLLDKSNPNTLPTQSTYNSNDSTTSTFIRSNFSIQNAESDLSGSAYTDIANFQFKFTQAFGSISQIHSSPEWDFPLDGSLGLGWGPFGDDPAYNYISPIVNLLSVYPLPLQFYTLWLGSHQPPSIAKTASGLITVGDSDNYHCDSSKIDYMKLTIDEDSLYMRFQIDGFSTNDHSLKFTAQAYLDSGSPVIQTSFDVYEAIYTALKPDYDFTNHVWAVDCSQVPNMPDLIFKIGGKNYSIESKNYVLDLDLEDGKCVLAFELSVDDVFVLGNPMLRSYCTVYELIGQRVGFLSLK